MKRISTIIMALAVVMTMAQCKKNNPTTPDNQNNVVTITLDVKNNNGSRVDVNTTTGTVDFETGDKVFVGSGLLVMLLAGAGYAAMKTKKKNKK